MSPGLSLAKRLILPVRIVGFSLVIIATALIIREIAGQFIIEGNQIAPARLAWLIVILAMAIAGCILSWRRLRLAGILLIISGVATGVDAAVISGRNQIVLLILGLGFAATGFIFLRSWRKLKARVKNSRRPRS